MRHVFPQEQVVANMMGERVADKGRAHSVSYHAREVQCGQFAKPRWINREVRPSVPLNCEIREVLVVEYRPMRLVEAFATQT